MKTLDRSSVAIMLENFALLALTQHARSKTAYAVAEQLRTYAGELYQCREHAIGSGIESYAFARCYMLFCRLYVRMDIQRREADRKLFEWTHKRHKRLTDVCFQHIPLDAYRSLMWILDSLAEDRVWRQLFDSSLSKMEV